MLPQSKSSFSMLSDSGLECGFDPCKILPQVLQDVSGHRLHCEQADSMGKESAIVKAGAPIL